MAKTGELSERDERPGTIYFLLFYVSLHAFDLPKQLRMDTKTTQLSELEIQKEIAYTSGILQGDVTIKTLLESMAEGIVIVHESGRIVLINNRLSELSGYSKREVVGMPLTIFIPVEHHASHAGHLSGYFHSPRKRPMGVGLELNARKKDGTVFPAEISLSFLETENGKLSMAFISDISWRKKVQEELIRKNEELDAFAQTVAHDLASSLSGIVGFSEMLMQQADNIPEEEYRKFLGEIANSGRQMTNVVRELLIFASLKKEEVEVSVVSINQLVEHVTTRLSYQINETNAEIRCASDMPNCYGYGAWVEEVIFNFVSNALKYGGSPPRITISYEITADDRVAYSVQDNGAGIDQDLFPILFADKSAEKSKLVKGFGLGLPIVKRIIDKLGGTVSVQSSPENGTAFTFTLKKYEHPPVVY